MIVAAFLVRLPALAEPIGIDQGIFAAVADVLAHGGAPYVDAWDQKPPGIHLAYLGAFSIIGRGNAAIVWMDLGAALLTMAALYVLARRLAGPTTGLACAVVFAVLTIPAGRYALGGFLERAVPETFIVCLVAIAMALVPFAAARPRLPLLIAMGVLAGIAATFKPTALVYWPVLAVGIALLRGGSTWRSPRIWGSLALGIVLPVAATVLWLASRGALDEARVAVVEYNRAYLGVGDTSVPERSRLFGRELWRRLRSDPLWVLGAAGVLSAVFAGRARLTRSPLPVLAALWAAAALIAAAANGPRLFNSYFIPVLAPLALLAGWGLAGAHRIPPRWRLAFVALAAIVVVRHGFVVRAWSSTAADLEQLVARDDGGRTAYLERFGGYGNGRGYSARANSELTEYLRNQTSPEDRVFIFGMQPGVYHAAERLPAHRFVWVGPVLAGFLDRPDFSLEGLAGDLARNPPAVIVLERNNRDSAMGWRSDEAFEREPMRRVLGAYVRAAEIEDFVVYRRRGPEAR